MIALGIDPGLAHTGYGVVADGAGRLTVLDHGTIRTPSSLATERRLLSVAERVGRLVAEHDCDVLAVERLYFGQNAQSALEVGQALGAVKLAAVGRGLECFEYTPQQVKAAVCGRGGAGKGQVGRMVEALLAMEGKPGSDHAADALAVAVCHLNHAPFGRALRAVAAAP
jgi:crossover junction endodeoxyribonuclease RuvC